MEFEKIEDVPNEIVEFYFEETVDDVVCVHQKTFTERKSISDLERVIALGKSEKVRTLFAKCVVTNYLATFLESYVEYLENYAKWEVLKDAFEPFEGSVFDLVEPTKPTRYTPTLDEVIQPYLSAAFKDERSTLMNNLTVEVDGMVFDGDEISQNRMVRAITVLSGDDKVPWTLANNSIVYVTQTVLKQVLTLAGVKQSEMWANPHR